MLAAHTLDKIQIQNTERHVQGERMLLLTQLLYLCDLGHILLSASLRVEVPKFYVALNSVSHPLLSAALHYRLNFQDLASKFAPKMLVPLKISRPKFLLDQIWRKCEICCFQSL